MGADGRRPHRGPEAFPVKLRSDSFAARLTPAQRDELFIALAGGLGLPEAAAKVSEWTKAEWGGRRTTPSTVWELAYPARKVV